jgi:hypothetical protein
VEENEEMRRQMEEVARSWTFPKTWNSTARNMAGGKISKEGTYCQVCTTATALLLHLQETTALALPVLQATCTEMSKVSMRRKPLRGY